MCARFSALLVRTTSCSPSPQPAVLIGTRLSCGRRAKLPPYLRLCSKVYCSVMTNLYASVSTAKLALLVSTVSRRSLRNSAPVPLFRGPDTVAISSRYFLCYIVGLALSKGVFISATCFRRLVCRTVCGVRRLAAVTC